MPPERTNFVTAVIASSARPRLARRAAESLWSNQRFASPERACSGVLVVSALPRELRMQVERAMLVCLRSEPVAAPAGTDPLSAQWFTPWERDMSVVSYYAVRTRQVITGTHAELNALTSTLEELAREHGFGVSINELN